MSRSFLYGGIALALAAVAVGLWYLASLQSPVREESRSVEVHPVSNVGQLSQELAPAARDGSASIDRVLSPSELLEQRDAQQGILLTDKQIDEIVNSMERLPYDKVVADAAEAEKKAFEKFIDPMPPELIEAMNQPAPPPLTEAQIQEAVNATNLRYD